jgi:hypothetical protein
MCSRFSPRSVCAWSCVVASPRPLGCDWLRMMERGVCVFFCAHAACAQNGKVTAALIGTLVRALGKNPLQKEVDAWVSELGGADTPIDVATVKKVQGGRARERDVFAVLTFASQYYNQKLPKPRDQERDMREAFKVLDIQGKGFINEAELRQIMCTLGEPLTQVMVASNAPTRVSTFCLCAQEEFNLLMTKCQKDDDGTIMVRFISLSFSFCVCPDGRLLVRQLRGHAH